MNRVELTELLEEIAKKDIADGCDIFDHPCSVAVRALSECFDDIRVLKGTLSRNNIRGKSKREQMLIGLDYTPTW